MKITTLLISLSVIILLTTCVQNLNQNINNGRQDVRESKVIDISQLDGIWAENEHDNANFKIKGDSMYFLEDFDNPVFIVVKNDTIYSHFDELITIDVILYLTKDSLILLNELDDTINLNKR